MGQIGEWLQVLNRLTFLQVQRLKAGEGTQGRYLFELVVGGLFALVLPRLDAKQPHLLHGRLFTSFQSTHSHTQRNVCI